MLSLIFALPLAILDTVNSYVEPIVNKLLDVFNGQEPWMQAAALLVMLIFVLIGLFVFIKKFIKLFLVLAILGAIFYYVYTQTDLLSSLTGSITYITKVFFAYII